MREFDIRLGECSPDAHCWFGSDEKCRCGEKTRSMQRLKEIDHLRAENAALRKALATLRNEVRGTLHAHELAIRYDSGNSNWTCLEMALEGAEKALARLQQKEGGAK